MPGLAPGIHVLHPNREKDVDGRVKPGHDDVEKPMNPLPIADAETTRFFHAWLETFSGYVRDVDYVSAKPLFHLVVRFEHSHPFSARTFANVRIKGPLANIGF